MAPASPQGQGENARKNRPAGSSALRREVLGALHTLTGTMEPWREVGLVMRRYLGPWVGMSATERWETLGPVELQVLADATVERAAIVTAQADAGRPREVIVCGGRDYQPTALDGRWVSWWLAFLSARTVIHGGARGVDRWAGTLAARLGLDAITIEADWTTHGKSAGPIRNRIMAARDPVAVLVLPGGAGTADMAHAACERLILTLEITDRSTHYREAA
jgi:hypothetical protein